MVKMIIIDGQPELYYYMKSSWALLSFRYMCVHTVERNGATWIQTYNNEVKQYEPIHNWPTVRFDYTYAIHKSGYLYINKKIQTVQLCRCLAVHVQRETFKRLQCTVICSAWACIYTVYIYIYITEPFVGLCTHSSVWKCLVRIEESVTTGGLYKSVIMHCPGKKKSTLP